MCLTARDNRDLYHIEFSNTEYIEFCKTKYIEQACLYIDNIMRNELRERWRQKDYYHPYAYAQG